jgi:hypothetical protein
VLNFVIHRASNINSTVIGGMNFMKIRSTILRKLLPKVEAPYRIYELRQNQSTLAGTAYEIDRDILAQASTRPGELWDSLSDYADADSIQTSRQE